MVAFQDINGFIQLGNLTADGWTLTQVNDDSIMGTGLALQPFYNAGTSDAIDLYNQGANLTIRLSTWVPASESGSGGEYQRPSKFTMLTSPQFPAG